MPELSKRKPVPFSQVLLKGVFIHNPVLVQVIGICPVVAAAKSLRAAALLAGVYSLILIVTQLIASTFLKKIVRWVRVAVYLLIGLAVVCPVMYFLEKHDAGIRITVGIYLPLLAANSLAAFHCEKIAVRSSIKHSFFDSIATSIGYSAVLLLVGFIRELLGSGTIADRAVSFIPASSGMLMPFGGFIVLGFMAALLKGFILRYYPKYSKEMSFDISTTAVTVKLKPELTAAPTNDKSTSNESAETPPPAVSSSEPGGQTGTQDIGQEEPEETDIEQPGTDDSGSKALPEIEPTGNSTPEEPSAGELLPAEQESADTPLAEPLAGELPFEEFSSAEFPLDESSANELPFEDTVPENPPATEQVPSADEHSAPMNPSFGESGPENVAEPDEFEQRIRDLLKFFDDHNADNE